MNGRPQKYEVKETILEVDTGQTDTSPVKSGF